MTRAFTLSPRVREFLRTGISGYCLVLPSNVLVPDDVAKNFVRVVRDERLSDGYFYVMPEQVFEGRKRNP